MDGDNENETEKTIQKTVKKIYIDGCLMSCGIGCTRYFADAYD